MTWDDIVTTNARDAILGASVCALLGLACLASGSATPLYVVLGIIGFIVGIMLF